MKILKKHFFFLLTSLLFICTGLQAQSINGDTIYVDNQAEVVVSFPSMPSNATTTPIDAPYNFITFGTGFTVRAKLKNTKAVPWVVIEGKRTHHFWIAYRRINYNNPEELHYDYSSTDKIKKRIRQQEESRTKFATNEASKPDAKKPPKDNSKDNVSFKYYSLLESGDQKLKKQEYAEAKNDFDKAIAMRPNEVYPKQKLEEVKIKLAEKAKKEDTKLKDVYNGYIASGEKFLKDKKLSEARTSFEQALVIVSDDKTAKKRLAQINDEEKELKEKEELENNYAAAVAAGDKAFQQEDYENAKARYAKALGFIKRPGPQQQIDEINKILSQKASKEASAKTAKAIEKEHEQKEAELQDTKKKYYAALQSADKLYAKGDLVKAKTAYSKALEIMDDPWPNDQIAKINKTLIERDQDILVQTAKQKQAAKAEKDKKEKDAKELEDRYTAALQTADKLFNAGDYAKARPAYGSAIGIVKKPYPQEQIKKIDKLLADQAVAAQADKIRLVQEKAITTKYETAIADADKEFGKTNYSNAKRLYQNALAIKPAEKYPKQKLNDIESALDRLAAEEKARKEKIAAEQELKKKYDIALSKAKYYFVKEDFQNALASYTEASKLKPGEAEPREQVKTITAKLEEVAKLQLVTDKYERKITTADSQLIAKNYEAAKSLYSEASSIKPSETYPNSQIKFILAEIKSGIKEKEENDKYEAIRLENEKDNKYHDVIVLADKAVADLDFAKAKEKYTEALTYRPESDYAKRRLKISSDQLEKIKSDSKDKSVARKDKKSKPDMTVTYSDDAKVEPVVPEKQSKSSNVFQENPMPYSAEELKAKYPGIDFAELPPEQPFNEDAVDSKENTKMFNEVLTDKPRLDLSDKNSKVKLICQGINFLDRNIYIKLLIQNNSDNDFLTGAMMLTWTRKLGNHIKLYPLYIYPAVLPVIKSGNESVVIYVCKAYSIADDEKLKFELTDRMNKIKLELNFRGAVYNEESVRF